MTRASDPWSLPGLATFLDEVVAHVERGLALVNWDPHLPVGLGEALRSRLRSRFGDVEQAVAAPGRTPAEIVAEPFGAAPTLGALSSPDLDQCAVMVSTRDLRGADATAWGTFLTRFHETLSKRSGGLAILVLDARLGSATPRGAASLAWTTHLRRGDLVIWAEQHLPASRAGLGAELAVALAVELCSWRLDLAVDCVRSSLENLSDTEAWLGLQAAAEAVGPRPVGGVELSCPLRLLRSNALKELQTRIWRAHLTAVFPWLEEQRLDLVQGYRGRLRVDDHQRSRGVREVDELELGAVRWQLDRKVDRSTLLSIERLVRLRNALAHRSPAQAQDLYEILVASSRATRAAEPLGSQANSVDAPSPARPDRPARPPPR